MAKKPQRSARKMPRRLPQSTAAPTPTKVALIVLGMHRSGTSALTRVLNLLGCDLPKTLLPASPGDNDLGFWESKVVMDLNNEILASTGSDWDDWMPFNPDWYQSPVSSGFHDRALTVLESEFGSSRLFVLKDPRICRLFKFWVEALRSFDAKPLIVAPIRNPLEVAASLNKRNGIDPSIAYLSWLRHTLEAESASRHLTRCYLRYDDLLASWHSVADRLSQNLDVAWPKDLLNTAGAVEQFLSPSLRHHHVIDKDVVKNPSLSLWVQTTFRILDRWTRESAQKSDLEELDRIKAAFDTATVAFARPVNSGRQAILKNRELERGVGEAQRQVAQSKAELETAAKAGAELRVRLTQADAALEQRGKEVDDARRQFAEVHKQVAQSKAELEAAAKAGAELRGRLTQADAALEQRGKEVDDAKRQIAEAQKQVAQSKSEAEMAAKASIELRDRLAHTESALAQRRHEAEETAAGLASVREELNRTKLAYQQSTLAHQQVEALATGFKDHVQLLLAEMKAAQAARVAAENVARTKDVEIEKLRAENAGVRKTITVEKAELEKQIKERFAELAILTRKYQENERKFADGKKAARAQFRRAVKELLAKGDLPQIPILSDTSFWKRQAVRRKAALLNRSGLLDAEWYLRRYKDIAQAGVDAMEHYINHGLDEGRVPSPDFE